MVGVGVLDAYGRPASGNGGIHLPAETMSEIRALTTSVLLERLQWARQAGLTFGGARDEYEILGYDRLITTRQYREEYERGGIAGRIVDALPNATWRGAFEIIEDEDPKNTTVFEKAWIELETKHQIQAKLNRVDKLAGLSTYAVLLIGAPVEADLSEELPKGRPDDLLYLTPFSGGGAPSTSMHQRVQATDADATIYEFETDPGSPRFGMPKSYLLRRTSFTSPAFARPVHWTRIIHIAENLLDDEVNGQPTLERVWNLLADLRKVTGGGAEAFWLRANQGLHLDIDKDMSLPDAQAAVAALKEQADAYKHQLTRWLRTRGVDVKTLGSDVANFGNPADAILTQIAGAKAIPKRILTGSEMGELASSQDRDNWKDQVNGRQTGYATPYIIRPLIDRLIEYGYLPTPVKGPREYQVRWPQMQVMTAAEKVEGAKGWASVNQTQGSIVFTDEEIRDRWEQMPPLTEDQRAEIAKRKAEAATVEAEAKAEAAPAEAEAKPARVLPFRAAKHGESYDFSSTQVQLPPAIAGKLFAFSAKIPDEILAEDGRENDAHVTVKYGIHTTDVEDVAEVLREQESVDLTLGRIAAFTGSPDYDVLYVEVFSDCLHRLNRQISENLEVTDTHPVYTPHATLAYVKKGEAERYVGDRTFEGLTASIGHVLFSSSDGSKGFIPLEAKPERTFVTAEEEELVRVLQAAIEAEAVEVIDAIVGEEARMRVLGGPGSGYFGHAGRPGQIGGSTKAGTFSSSAHKGALRTYVAGLESGLGSLNTNLRRGKALSRTHTYVVAKLDDLIATQVPVPEGKKLYRVVPPAVLESLNRGSVYRDNGFLSTVQDEDALDELMENIDMTREDDSEEFGIIKLTVGRGVRGVDVNSILSEDENEYSWQNELLLARGLVYKVTSKRRDEGDNIVVNMLVSKGTS